MAGGKPDCRLAASTRLAKLTKAGYGYEMGSGLRRILVFVVVIALVAAGMPLAQAASCAPAAQPTAAGHHRDAAASLGHRHRDATQGQTHSHRHDRNKLAFDSCKCLNCALCTTPVIAVPLRDVTPERRAVAACYRRVADAIANAPISVDPGIPIAAA